MKSLDLAKNYERKFIEIFIENGIFERVSLLQLNDENKVSDIKYVKLTENALNQIEKEAKSIFEKELKKHEIKDVWDYSGTLVFASMSAPHEICLKICGSKYDSSQLEHMTYLLGKYMSNTGVSEQIWDKLNKEAEKMRVRYG